MIGFKDYIYGGGVSRIHNTASWTNEKFIWRSRLYLVIETIAPIIYCISIIRQNKKRNFIYKNGNIPCTLSVYGKRLPNELLLQTYHHLKMISIQQAPLVSSRLFSVRYICIDIWNSKFRRRYVAINYMSTNRLVVLFCMRLLLFTIIDIYTIAFDTR